MTGAYLVEEKFEKVDSYETIQALRLAVKTVTNNPALAQNTAGYVELFAEHYYYFIMNGKFKKA